MKSVLKKIIDQYVSSDDHNGLASSRLTAREHKELLPLIDDGLIQILSEDETINPHVRMFNYRIPAEIQKSHIIDKDFYVVYPLAKALQSIVVDYASPYSAEVKKGAHFAKIVYFNVEVLERFAPPGVLPVVTSKSVGNVKRFAVMNGFKPKKDFRVYPRFNPFIRKKRYTVL